MNTQFRLQDTILFIGFVIAIAFVILSPISLSQWLSQTTANFNGFLQNVCSRFDIREWFKNVISCYVLRNA